MQILPGPGVIRNPAIRASAKSGGKPYSAGIPKSAARAQRKKTASVSTLQGLVRGIQRHLAR
eukprot:928193-Alexandrium_andersonii.AAC.1